MDDPEAKPFADLRTEFERIRANYGGRLEAQEGKLEDFRTHCSQIWERQERLSERLNAIVEMLEQRGWQPKH